MNFLKLVEFGCSHRVLLPEEGHLFRRLWQICIKVGLREASSIYLGTFSIIRSRFRWAATHILLLLFRQLKTATLFDHFLHLLIDRPSTIGVVWSLTLIGLCLLVARWSRANRVSCALSLVASLAMIRGTWIGLLKDWVSSCIWHASHVYLHVFARSITLSDADATVAEAWLILLISIIYI